MRIGESYVALLQDFCLELGLRPGETVRVADILITAPRAGCACPLMRPAEVPISSDLAHLAEHLHPASA